MSSSINAAFIATGKNVVVNVGNSNSGYKNKIYWSSDNFKTKHYIGIDNQVGSHNIGTFASGTKIEFGIDNGNGGFYKTGNGAKNPDGLVHARINKVKGTTTIGFEDFNGGGDQDFNDALIKVMNTTDTTTNKAPASSAVGGSYSRTVQNNSTIGAINQKNDPNWISQLQLILGGANTSTNALFTPTNSSSTTGMDIGLLSSKQTNNYNVGLPYFLSQGNNVPVNFKINTQSNGKNDQFIDPLLNDNNLNIVNKKKMTKQDREQTSVQTVKLLNAVYLSKD